MIKRSLKKSASLFETVLKPFEIACPEVYFRVHFWTRVFAEQKRRFCVEPRTSLSVLKRHFSSGTDAAGLNRSDVSASPKLVAKTIHGCIVLAADVPYIFKRTR